MKTLRRVAVCLVLCIVGCGEPERADNAKERAAQDAVDGGGQQSTLADGSAVFESGVAASADAGDLARSGVDAAVAGGPACAEHDDCDEGEICGAQQQCVAGCLPENEPCDPGGDERCCEHFHCCPVFHICVPNWWE